MDQSEDASETGSLLGLGFRTSGSAPSMSSISTGSHSEMMAQLYIQQCLDFHKEQQEIRKGQQDVVKQPHRRTLEKMQFVPSKNLQGNGYSGQPQEQQLKHPCDHFSNPCPQFTKQVPEHDTVGKQQTTLLETQNQDSNHASNLSSHDPIEEGRAKARAIFDRFQQQQHDLLRKTITENATTTNLPSTSTWTTATTNIDQHLTIEMPYHDGAFFRTQRQRGFEREAARKQAALIRNFEFVACREQERLAMIASSLEQQRDAEQVVNQQYQDMLNARKQKLAGNAVIKAGIGTKSQRKQQLQQERKQRCSHTLTDESKSKSVALYLTGLPKDGSTGETLLRQLFETYGKIQKVHFYKDKLSGNLKGDALVIFQVKAEENEEQFVLMVSSQVRMFGGFFIFWSCELSEPNFLFLDEWCCLVLSRCCERGEQHSSCC